MLSVVASSTGLKPCSELCRSYTWIPVSPAAGNWGYEPLGSQPDPDARTEPSFKCTCGTLSWHPGAMVLLADGLDILVSPAVRSFDCHIPRDPSLNTHGSQISCSLARPAWCSLWTHPDLQPAHRWSVPLVTIAVVFPCSFLPKTLSSLCFPTFGSSPRHPITGFVQSQTLCTPNSPCSLVRVTPLNLKTSLNSSSGGGNVGRANDSPVMAMGRAGAGYLFGFLHLLTP